MKAAIDVENRKEADAIKAGLEDPTVRAIVTVVGILMPLSPKARARVLAYATEAFEEEKEASKQ